MYTPPVRLKSIFPYDSNECITSLHIPIFLFNKNTRCNGIATHSHIHKTSVNAHPYKCQPENVRTEYKTKLWLLFSIFECYRALLMWTRSIPHCLYFISNICTILKSICGYVIWEDFTFFFVPVLPLFVATQRRTDNHSKTITTKADRISFSTTKKHSFVVVFVVGLRAKTELAKWCKPFYFYRMYAKWTHTIHPLLV